LLGSIDLGRVFGRSVELRGGVIGGYVGTEWASGIFPIPRRDDRILGTQARLLVDTLDDHRVPHAGVKIDIQLMSPQGWLGSDQEYDRLLGQAMWAIGVGQHTALIDVQAGTDLGSTLPYYQDFYLGGLRTISGYHVDRLRGSVFGLASAGWLHRLGGGALPFASRSYLGLWVDAGNVWFDQAEARVDDLLLSAAVSLLLETPLGPLHLGYGRTDDGSDAFHVDFGIHLGTPAN
jgi:NTE family protein